MTNNKRPTQVASSMANSIGFEIPGVGFFRPTFDLVVILVNEEKSVLRERLPISELEQAAYSFRLERVRGKYGWTRLKAVCLPDGRLLKLLKDHEECLGEYRVTRVEISADHYDCDNNVERAKEKRNALVRTVGKRNHQRGFLQAVDCDSEGKYLPPEKLESRGLIDRDFTLYSEEKDADLNLKIYVRREKLANGAHGNIGCRVEFVLNGNRPAKRHLGGDRLDDLLNADLHEFFRQNLIVWKVDFVRLGNLLNPRLNASSARSSDRSSASTSKNGARIRQLMNDPTYQAQRSAYLVIFVLDSLGRTKPPLCDEEILKTSPAHIRAVLRWFFGGPDDQPLDTLIKKRWKHRPTARTPKRVLRKWEDYRDRARHRTGPNKYGAVNMRSIDKCFVSVPLK
ncbi:hypothetical protein AB2N04_06420 [Nitratireductor sp. GISD-1A_MAKvit]|uniref:hypothetical protein n=1 Tax=Nitratireductor sp. GISD-1A_MAKvit TaxID=3234198 RepID=UPI0034673DB8